MNYSIIKPVDIADGPGVRVSLFVSGCRNHCKGCFQPETWDFGYGKAFDGKALYELRHLMDHDYIQGLTVLGGDPMEPENCGVVNEICKIIKTSLPNKDIWIYTGYLFEHLDLKLLEYVDVLVDGPFVEAKKDLNLKFRGSSNQRIIDVKKSLDASRVVLWQETEEQM